MPPRPPRAAARYPDAAERRYTAALLRRVALLHRATLQALGRHIDGPPRDGVRVDAVSDLATTTRVVEALRAVFAGPFAPSTSDVRGYGEQVDLFATRAASLALSIPRVEIAASTETLTAWTRDNVDLIKTIDARYFDDVQAAVTEAYRKGTPTRDVTKMIAEWYGVSRSNARRIARRIARDQIGKLNGDLSRDKQTAAGVVEYVWRTSRDERVRGRPGGLFPHAKYSHWDREGQVFRWDDPPPDGHPGRAIQCRCTASPVIRLRGQS